MSKFLKSRNFLRIIVLLLFACILGTAMSFLFNNTRKNSAQAALTGAGTKLDPVKIYSVEDLQQLATNVNNGTDNYYDKYVKLMNNIDLSPINNWTPIGNTNTQAKTFQGHFDGNGKTISNLTINSSGAYLGLFGYTTGATIEKVTISNPDIYCSNAKAGNVGALVGYFWTGILKVNNVNTERKGEITDCHLVGGYISSAYYHVGGLVGYVQAANSLDHGVIITKCTVKGTGSNLVPAQISGVGNVGSIVGLATGLMYKALSTGASQAGVHISACTSTATITVDSGIGGGIIGRAQGVLVEQCYTTGVTRTRYCGTIGGIVGQIDTAACKVADCFTMGDVSGAGTGTGDYANNGSTYAGGIVGIISGIADCYVQNCLVTGNVLVCTPWSHHSHTSSGSCRGCHYSSGVAGGIVGRVDGKTAYVGACAVASRQVSGVSNRTTSVKIDSDTKARTNIAIALSSPFANGWTNANPTMIPNTKNIYNKDMWLSEQRFLGYKACTSIEGDKVNLSAFKDVDTYNSNGLGWTIDAKGTGNIWGIGKGFNNGYPYLRNCPKAGQVEYPYGSVYNPILINNEDDFAEMRDNCNNGGEHYDGLYLKQTADLDMTDMGMVGSAYGTVPTAEYRKYSFRGNYDGNMFRMKNVHIVVANSNMGMFGFVFNASFKNVIVENPFVNNETVGSISCAGIFIGQSLGNLYMDNCAILGGRLAVPKMLQVGAFVGAVSRTGNYITRCFSSATVVGGTGVGGLVGSACGIHMSQSYCTGDVKNMLSTWGYKSNGYSYNNYARGTGGLIGELYRPYGGVTSSTSGKTVTINNSALSDALCYAYDESLTANATTNTSYSTIDNCYASGTITDYSASNNHSAAGGIVGRALGEAVISNTYFNGTLEASGTSTTCAENVGAIVGITDGGIVNVQINNCLSAIKSVSQDVPTATKIRAAGYYSTYRATVTQSPSSCFYVPVTDMPAAVTTNGGGAMDGGTETTLADVAAGKIFGSSYAISNDDGSTTTVSGLEWDMADVWTLDPNLNGGFPMLKGLIVDTTELNAAIAEARTFNGENFSEETFSALMKLVDSADKEITERTITEYTKVQYAEAIIKAIEALRPDTSKLQALYDSVNKDMLPYKEFYVSFTLVDSLLPGAKEILENSENFYNNDVKSVYDSLKLAVDNLRINKTELNKAIEEANAIMLNASSYPDNEIKTLDGALKNAVKVNNDDAVLAPQVNNATKTLQEALANMAIDKTGLLNQIIESYAYIGVVVKYDVALGDTDKSIMVENDNNRVMSLELINYTEFEKALNNAVTVLQNKESPSQTVLNAMFELDVAKNALKLKTDKLQELSSQAAALLLNEKYYTAESIAKLKTEKAIADGIINATASEETLAKRRDDYDASCKSLAEALKVEPNKTELMQTITRAKAENKNELYTDETYNKLQEEITKAQAVYDNANATVKEIYAAISALNDALQNLDISLDYLKDLIKQARYVLDNAAVKALYTTGIDELDNRTGKAEELCKINASEVNVTDVKTTTRLLEAALNALTVSKDEMNRYIRMALTDYADDYVKDGEYSAESTQVFRDLAQDALNKRDSMTDEEIVSYTIRLKTAYDNLKANGDALAIIVNRLSAMSNKKYRQDNDGKWIVDESTGNMKVFVIYEDKSWKVLETELAKAKELLLNLKATPTQINDSIAALTAAEEGLIVDTSELELRMKKAVELLAQVDLYKADSLSALQEAYNAAKTLLDEAKESGEKLVMKDVQARLDALLFAIGNMEADIDAIHTLLSAAETLLGYKQYFTANTIANLQSNYKQVNSLIEQGAELDASSVALLSKMLSDAMKSLEITTEELQAFVTRYETLKVDKEYILGFESFAESISTYKGLLKKSALKITTYSEAIDKVSLYSTAIIELQSAVNNFTVNWPAYEELVNEGKAVIAKADEGTDTSSLETAVDDADVILADKTGTTFEDVLVSIRALKNGLKGMKSMELDQLIQTTKAAMAKTTVNLDGEESSGGGSSGEGDGDGEVETGTKLSIYYGDGVTVADTYTTKSYKTLLGAIKNGEAVLKLSNADYDLVENAITVLENAIAGLVVDPALLNCLIKECEVLYSDEYYETDGNAAYENYAAKLDASKTVIATPTTTLVDYINSYNDLVEAKGKLVFKSGVLGDIIAAAEKKIADDGTKCTGASVAALQAQITSAKACTAAAGSNDYNKACNDLLDAIANLTYTDELQKEITRVQPFVEYGNPDEVGNYYSDGSFQELVDLLNSAKALLDKEDLRQYEVDSMIALLKVCDDTEDGLLLIVTEEKKYVDAQKAFIAENEGMYTYETWKPYTEAVANLESVIKLPKYEVTTAQIAEAKKAVEDAIKDLEEDTNKVFMLKESNTTFKFVYGDGTEVIFGEHQYEEDKPIYLKNIALNDSVADIVAQFENTDVKAYNAKGEEIADMAAQVVATGIVLKVMAGEQVLDVITLVLVGDVNGDGKVTAIDQSQLNTHVKGMKQLTGAYWVACDVNGDKKITAIDQSQLNTHVKGFKKLYEGLSVKGAA